MESQFHRQAARRAASRLPGPYCVCADRSVEGAQRVHEGRLGENERPAGRRDDRVARQRSLQGLPARQDAPVSVQRAGFLQRVLAVPGLRDLRHVRPRAHRRRARLRAHERAAVCAHARRRAHRDDGFFQPQLLHHREHVAAIAHRPAARRDPPVHDPDGALGCRYPAHPAVRVSGGGAHRRRAERPADAAAQGHHHRIPHAGIAGDAPDQLLHRGCHRQGARALSGIPRLYPVARADHDLHQVGVLPPAQQRLSPDAQRAPRRERIPRAGRFGDSLSDA